MPSAAATGTMSWTDARPVETALDEYTAARWRFFRYRREADVATKTALALGFAALTGVAAQVRVPLPFTPVPVTLQTFAVLLAGLALGWRWGGASQALYAGLGAAGIPWFTGMGAGLGTVLGPTGGYLVGFVFAAALVGYAVDRHPAARRPPVLLGVLLVANFGIIYGVGLPWLYGWFALATGSTPALLELLTMGLFPFVPGDVVKLLGAMAVGTLVLPSEPRRTGARPPD